MNKKKADRLFRNPIDSPSAATKRVRRGTKKNLWSRIKQKMLMPLICVAVVGLCASVVLYALTPVKYDIVLGERSEYDIDAPRDIVNTVVTEQHAIEAKEQVQPVVIRQNISAKQMNELAEIFDRIKAQRRQLAASVSEESLRIPGFQQGFIPTGGVAIGVGVFSEERTWINSALNEGRQIMDSLDLAIEDDVLPDLFLYASNEQIDRMEKTMREVLVRVYENDIFDENVQEFLDYASMILLQVELNEHLQSFGETVFEKTIRPNSVVDQARTNRLQTEAYENALINNRTIVKANERIISVGETVTADKYQMLEDLNMIKDGKTNYLFSVSVYLIVLLLFLPFIFYFLVLSRKKLNIGDVLLVGMVMVLILVFAAIIPKSFLYLLPTSMAVMLITILLNERIAFVTNLVLALCLSWIYNWHVVFLIMTLLSGTLIIFPLKKATRRSQVSLCGLLAGAINVMVILIFSLYYGPVWMEFATHAAYAFTSGILASIITVGLLPLIEVAFDIVTPFKLLELTNPNQPLMKKLLREAPGTYYHSLMVGNLAETATERIGGNALLARVGAYYHDIGKLRRPGFFGENLMGAENPHDKMSPELSRSIIASHTKDGVGFAKDYKLPDAIHAFILKHHGTTILVPFYEKAKKEAKHEQISADDFRYPGNNKPNSIESAVVMLADSVEAAVKSVSSNPQPQMEEKINRMIKQVIVSKRDDDQFDQCDLTYKDLDLIATAFREAYSGYFHHRLEYPSAKKDGTVKRKRKGGESDAT